MSTIAESLLTMLRRELGPGAEIRLTERTPTRGSDGYAFDTVRNGRTGAIRIGADTTTRDGHTPATEAAIDAEFRATFRLAPR